MVLCEAAFQATPVDVIGDWEMTMAGGPIGDMSIVHKGKVDGDTMSATIAMGDRGEMKWTAKRVKK